MSYFLEEVTVSANQSLMERTRDAYIAGEYGSALEILEAYQAPDEVFDQEAALLRCLCRMELAEQALSQGRLVYARQLLEAAGEEQTMYWNAALERRRLLALGQAWQGRQIALPVDDRELLLRARAALDAGAPERAGQYLEAAEDSAAPEWCYLRGMA
jgi:hypothetical protein